MFLDLYFKWRELEKKVYAFIQTVKFFGFLIRTGAFEKGDPKVSLMVLSKYLSLAAFGYPLFICNNRSLDTSVDLFSVLVNKYMDTNSEVHLDQILGIYKEDFIKRSLKKDGRKQF